MDDHFTHPPLRQFLSTMWEEVADGFQIAGFVASALRNLHLEKACLLVEHKAENISCHTGNSSPSSVMTHMGKESKKG